MSDTAPKQVAPEVSFVRRLDARQRAMLAEMGVHIWTPRINEAPSQTAPPIPIPVPAEEPPLRTANIESMDWSELEAVVAGCRACSLCGCRINTVFGAGHRQADWMIVGEAPNAEEDQQGRPFSGTAGKLLDGMLHAVGRSRTGEGEKGVYIVNAIKCRPPITRKPEPVELGQCKPYLARQIALVRPKVIIAMGPLAVQLLLGSTEPIGQLRGRVHCYQGVSVIVTYHLPYLLRNPIDKGKAWADLCLAVEESALYRC